MYLNIARKIFSRVYRKRFIIEPPWIRKVSTNLVLTAKMAWGALGVESLWMSLVYPLHPHASKYRNYCVKYPSEFIEAELVSVVKLDS